MAGGAASERRTRKDAQRNLERVLQAAHELFAQRGTAVTMEEIARHAGVGVGTVYRRFPTKEHLIAAVTHAACSHTHRCLEQAFAEEHDPVHRLTALVLVQYQRGAQQAGLLDPHANQGTGAGTAGGDDQQQLYHALHHMLAHLITDGQQHGLLDDGDTSVLAALCLELLQPRAYQNIQRLIGGEPEDVASHVVRFMMRGLTRR